MEKRSKIRNWETERDDLNEKLDSCQDKLRIVRDNESGETKADDDLMAAAKVRYLFNTFYCISEIQALNSLLAARSIFIHDI